MTWSHWERKEHRALSACGTMKGDLDFCDQTIASQTGLKNDRVVQATKLVQRLSSASPALSRESRRPSYILHTHANDLKTAYSSLLPQ